jgi:DNA-binding PadR family transcriptional regulator
MSKIWHTHSINSKILELLRRKGAMKDTELYEALKENINELGMGEFNKILMSMEVQGLIIVSSLTRGKRRVELVNAKS